MVNIKMLSIPGTDGKDKDLSIPGTEDENKYVIDPRF